MFSVVAAWAFVWRTLDIEPESRGVLGESHAETITPVLEHIVRPPTTEGERNAVLSQRALAEPDPRLPVIAAAKPPPRSLLAREFNDVMASFPTDQPRVADLLSLFERFASFAIVDPGSVTVERNQEGDLILARGSIAIWDLSGRFRIDPDGNYIEFVCMLDEGSWSPGILQFAFKEGGSGARGCRAMVEFQRKQDPDATRRPGEEYVGWIIETNGITARARPRTMPPVDDTLRNSGAGRQQPFEFPWAPSYTSGFDDWQQLLKEWTSR